MLDVAGDAGTAFDGKHLFQIAEAVIQKIDPATGEVLGTIPAPGNGGDSGLAWADGSLWVGQHRARRIHQVDPETGAVLRTIESDRFVTGVTWVDSELWHGTWEGETSERSPHRPHDRRGARAPRNAGGDRRVGARVGRRRPVLLWRRERQWKGESHPPTEKLTKPSAPECSRWTWLSYCRTQTASATLCPDLQHHVGRRFSGPPHTLESRLVHHFGQAFLASLRSKPPADLLRQ